MKNDKKKEITLKNILNLKNIPDSYESLQKEIQILIKTTNLENFYLSCCNLYTFFDIKNEDQFNRWKQYSRIYGTQFLIAINQNIEDNQGKETKYYYNDEKKETKNYIEYLMKIKQELSKDIDNCEKNKKFKLVEFEIMEKKFNELKAQAEDYNKQKMDIEKTIENIKKKKGEYDLLKQNLEEKQREKDDISKEIATLQNVKKNLTDTNREYKTKNDEAKKKNEEMEIENKKLKNTIEVNKKTIEIINKCKEKIESYPLYKNKVKKIEEEYKRKLNNIESNINLNFNNIINNVKKNTDCIFIKNFNKLLEEEKKRNIKCNKILNDYQESKKESIEYIHSTQFSHGIICDKCKKDIKGIRYKCSKCFCQYNLCEKCEVINYLKKEHLHLFYIIRKPIEKKLIDSSQYEIKE